MSTYQELIAQSNELLRQANEMIAVARNEGIQRALLIINEFELNAYDLGLVPTQSIKGSKARAGEKTFVAKLPHPPVPPKYRDEATGKTWSGRGHAPLWLVGDRDDFLIEPARELHAA
jgi:DNA-binding protein H-NS